MEKRIMVAVELDKNGKCLKISKVINANEKQVADYINEQNEEIEKQAREKAELLETIKSLEQDISLLKSDIRVLKGEDNND